MRRLPAGTAFLTGWVVLICLLLMVIAHADECRHPGVVWSCMRGRYCDPVPVLFTCMRADGSTYAARGFADAREPALDIRPWWLRERIK